MWVARNQDGTLIMTFVKPVRVESCWLVKSNGEISYLNRGESFKYQVIQIPKSEDMFSELKWEDEPVKVSLVPEDNKYEGKNKFLMPVAKAIGGNKLLEVFETSILNYASNVYAEHYYDEFITIDEFKDGAFYTDNYEYEMFLSDEKHFIGTDIRWYSEEKLDKFIEENGHLLEGELKILFVDYPECK